MRRFFYSPIISAGDEDARAEKITQASTMTAPSRQTDLIRKKQSILRLTTLCVWI